jgi:type I restriction enzyme R subunit
MESQADLARCQADPFWTPLAADGIGFLRNAIQPLFRVVSQADFKAMRFEKDVLEASLAHLKTEKDKYTALTENLIAHLHRD